MALALWLGRIPSPVTWYLTRSAAIVLYLLLWLAVVTGLGLTTDLLAGMSRRSAMFSIHAFAVELAYGFLALHLLSLAADPTVRFGPRELLVPFATRWHEPWTGLGVIAAGLTVIIGASFSAKRVIGQCVWRALHGLTFPLYALALAHGIGAGSDAPSLWLQAVYLATAAVVLLCTLYRLLRRGSRPRSFAPVSRPVATGVEVT
jgi:hypothetical protein